MRSASQPESEAPVLIQLVDDSSSGRSLLGETFRSWADSGDLRVLFTPEVLIAVSNASVRGYLYDDGWTVECWIERGVLRLRESLDAAFEGAEVSYAVIDSADGRSCAGLLDLAMDKGEPIDVVRHLI